MRILFAAGLLLFLCGASADASGREVPARTTLLVLPFENAAHNPKVEWIGEGLAELGFERLSCDGRTLRVAAQQLLHSIESRSPRGDPQ